MFKGYAMKFPVKVGVVAVSALCLTLAGAYSPILPAGSGAAWAQGQGQGGPDDRGGPGGPDDRGGAGQGGPGEDSEGQGPRAGQGSPGDSGGMPIWAREGIPEVELGRLSVIRSPDQVIDRAFAEALASISPDMVAFYNLSLSDMITELSLNWDNVTIIDSPLQNLALFKDALDGTSALAGLGVTNDIDTLMAVFLGVASDKNVPVSANTVIAVTTIIGSPITGAAAEALAADAEAIRIAVLAGHG